ncbi:hypothetical protein XENOCAPTIV_031001 [Xenoophorus captivus]|uniref:Uncharacterized protein n=1 Tax=Xenoophorus captivus TaxID=1517983 RepID=A0ABV0SCC9_9TELE
MSVGVVQPVVLCPSGVHLLQHYNTHRSGFISPGGLRVFSIKGNVLSAQAMIGLGEQNALGGLSSRPDWLGGASVIPPLQESSGGFLIQFYLRWKLLIGLMRNRRAQPTLPTFPNWFWPVRKQRQSPKPHSPAETD